MICLHRTWRILKDSLFTRLTSDKTYRIFRCRITRQPSSFSAQAVRLLNSFLTLHHKENIYIYIYCVDLRNYSVPLHSTALCCRVTMKWTLKKVFTVFVVAYSLRRVQLVKTKMCRPYLKPVTEAFVPLSWWYGLLWVEVVTTAMW